MSSRVFLLNLLQSRITKTIPILRVSNLFERLMRAEEEMF